MSMYPILILFLKANAAAKQDAAMYQPTILPDPTNAERP